MRYAGIVPRTAVFSIMYSCSGENNWGLMWGTNSVFCMFHERHASPHTNCLVWISFTHHIKSIRSSAICVLAHCSDWSESTLLTCTQEKMLASCNSCQPSKSSVHFKLWHSPGKIQQKDKLVIFFFLYLKCQCMYSAYKTIFSLFHISETPDFYPLFP